jgi:F0F1-type ATP synthase assembly protein I
VPQDREEQKKNALAQVARYSEIGFIIPAAVILGYVLGRVLDFYLHTRSLHLVGVIFGAVAGFVQMIRMALSDSK